METITARPNAKLCIGLMAVFALLPVICVIGIHTSPPTNPDAPVWPFDLMTLGMLLGIGAFLGVQLPKHIRADAAGLHWQRNGFMAWDEIADFYISPVVKQNQPTPHIVESASGKKVLFYPDWTDASVLRDAITARARSAKTDRWGVKGTRRVDEWPRTFAYPKPRDAKIIYGVFGSIIALIVGYGFYNLVTKLPRNIAEMGWGWGLSFGFVYLLVIVILPVLKIGLMLRITGMGVSRAGENVTVDKIGVVWQKPDTRIAARWDEITALKCHSAQINAPARWVVQTANGTFEFGVTIENVRILRDVLQENAPDGVVWRDDPKAEMIGGVRITPRTAGATVHHVRTRTHRALLGLLTAFALLIPVAPAVRFLVGLPVKAESVFFTILVTCFFVSTAWAWLWFFRSRIERDDMGITQHNIFSTRRLLWHETTRFYHGGTGDMGVCVLNGRGGKIRFYDGITEGAALIAEIERRRAS